jgi:hypothetical protein
MGRPSGVHVVFMGSHGMFMGHRGLGDGQVVAPPDSTTASNIGMEITHMKLCVVHPLCNTVK